MIALELLIAASTLAPSPTPEIQRPAAKTTPAETAAPAEDATPEAAAEPAAAEEPAAEPEAVAAEPAPVAEPEDPVAEPAPVAEPEPAPVAEPVVEPEPSPPVRSGETFTVAAGEGGPPFYDEADAAALRKRHGIPETAPEERTEPARWRCLIADPTCGTSFEVNALAAYAYRGRQGSVDGKGDDPRWSSGRAQYDFWMNLPVMTETAGRTKFTRMTLGPKAGAIFSDTGDTWGNLGVAMRYWFGRGRWAPTLEFSSALAFKVGSRKVKNLGGAEPKWEMQRGPVGFTADVGVGLGGFGAIVVGGQYDSPLAREDVPEQFRVSAGGAFFVGFRGNILWGAPAAAAIATHAATQRSVEAP